MISTPTATHTAALETLEDFLPRIPAYVHQRGFVRADHQNVSRLSPFIRRRIITEQEVVRRVLEVHSFQVAEKFIQEVVWRTYWKGWLARYPSVWSQCVRDDAEFQHGRDQCQWGDSYERACRGETHLSFFNDWVRELCETGYLHNHVRMWFASVWVFTLRLPWQLGAMWMYRHLLDGDPASNTLSWRWVAGLQTKGKSYLARPDNIATFSEGRWQPRAGELAESVVDAVCEKVELTERVQPDARSFVAPPSEPYGVITTAEDLSIERESELMSGATATALLRHQSGRLSASLAEVDLVRHFVRDAEDAALVRLGVGAAGLGDVDEVRSWIATSRLTRVVVVAPAVGPNQDALADLELALAGLGVSVSFYRRAWDAELHELADKGFFPFWERVKKRIQRGDPLFHGKSGVK